MLQTAMLCFMTAEQESVDNLHKRFKAFYGDDAAHGNTAGLWVIQVQVTRTREQEQEQSSNQ